MGLRWKFHRNRLRRSLSLPRVRACLGITASGSATHCTWKCRGRCTLSRRDRRNDMARVRFPKVALCVLLLLGSAPWGAARAAIIEVAAGSDLQAAIEAASDGDVLRLASGDYRGNIVVDRPLTLEGPEDRSATIIGEREGRSIWITAEDVVVRNLTVRNSGLSLPDMDAGIFLDRSAHRARVENNDVLDNLVGVYVWGPDDAL